MEGHLRRRFWVESAMALGSGILLLVTVLWPDWIEMVFGLDPDQHSGSLERLIVILALAIAVSCTTLAWRQWYHRQPIAT